MSELDLRDIDTSELHAAVDREGVARLEYQLAWLRMQLPGRAAAMVKAVERFEAAEAAWNETQKDIKRCTDEIRAALVGIAAAEKAAVS